MLVEQTLSFHQQKTNLADVNIKIAMTNIDRKPSLFEQKNIHKMALAKTLTWCRPKNLAYVSQAMMPLSNTEYQILISGPKKCSDKLKKQDTRLWGRNKVPPLGYEFTS